MINPLRTSEPERESGTPEEHWRDILKQIAQGSESALEACYRHFGPAIHRFLLTRGAREDEALLILNEVMLEVWRTADRFRGEARVLTWLLSIAHHRFIDHVRRETRHDALDIDECTPQTAADPEPDRLTDNQLEMDRLSACLDHLPPESRQLIYLVFREELPYEEIARILDCPQGTIKSRVFHVRRTLRKCLEGGTAKS